MSLRSDIITAFSKSNKSCTDCLDSTSEATFWLYDPPSEKDGFTQLLIIESPGNNLKVENPNELTVEFAALDKCLLPRAEKKCDCLLSYRTTGKLTLNWVELKMETTTQNLNMLKKIIKGDIEHGGTDTGAITQILNAKRVLSGMQVPLQKYQHRAHIGIPQRVEKVKNVSNTIQRLLRTLQSEHQITVNIGSVLRLTRK